jgi:hypothetical protein
VKRAEIVRLAHDISRDLEDPSVSTAVVVTKALRLATFVENEFWKKFFAAEATGYLSGDKDLDIALQATGRWDGKSEIMGGPIGVFEANIRLWKEQIEAQKAFQPSGEWAGMQHHSRMQAIAGLSGSIVKNERTITIVRGMTHNFCTQVIGQFQFSLESKSIFDSFARTIDQRLGELAEEAFRKLPDAFERLDTGSPEAISHALTSCRRIIDSFADSVFPAQAARFIIGNESISVAADKQKNRILAYVHGKVSGSRYDRIRRSLFDLYERVSAGVHSNIVPTEAKALVLQTYLLLGEIAELPAFTARI